MTKPDSKRTSFPRKRESRKSPLPQPLSRKRERVAERPGEGSGGTRPAITLKSGREKSLLRRHPWIFSGAIEHVDGALASGDTLPVRDASGTFLAWAAYNPDSKITARVWSWREEEVIDAGFFHRRIGAALEARQYIFPSPLVGSTKSTQSTTRQVACGIDRAKRGGRSRANVKGIKP